jgi:hypothetical protein
VQVSSGSSPLPESDAVAIVRAMLDTTPRDLVWFRPTVGGDDSYSYRFSVDGVPLLLKVKRKPGSPIGRIFYQRIRDAGVPVPDLVAYAPNAGPAGVACAIWSWVDGLPAEWGAGEPCPYDEAELGEILRRIHDLRYDGAYGLLGDDPENRHFASHFGLGSTCDHWSDFFKCHAVARRYFDKGYLDAREVAVLSMLPRQLDEGLDRAPKALLHMGDIMHNGNLIVGPDGHIAAVIDYVESTIGDPRWELAWFDYYFAQYPFAHALFGMERFRAAYGTNHDPGDELGRFYMIVALLIEKLLIYDPQTPRGAWAIRTVKDVLHRAA